MEDEAQPRCQFHQTGHCKYGTTCRLINIGYTCSDSNCDAISCTKRHPRLFQYFFQKGHCRYGAKCSYRRCSSAQESDSNYIEIIKDELHLVKTALKKSRIRETLNLSTDADSRTNTIFDKLRDLFIFSSS